MGTCRALILAGAAVFGVAGAALAADLPPPPPLEYAPEPVSFSGWYLRGDAGVGFAESPEIRSTFDAGHDVPDFRVDKQSISTGGFIGAGVGYEFNSWLRFDATGEYRTPRSFSAIESYNCTSFNNCNGGGAGRGYDKYFGNIESGVFLVNGYADIGTWYGFTPFVGAGVGAALHHVSSTTDIGIGGTGDFGLGGYGVSASKDVTNLAWAAMVGVGYAVAPNVRLELGYRYLDMGDVRGNPIGSVACASDCAGEVQKIHLASHDVRLGVRWLFDDIVPQPVIYPVQPMPPLIRKD